MSTRASKLTVIGTAIGLVLMGSAITPAAAAPQPATLSASTCSSLKGLTTTGSTASFSGVALKAGDTITASVSPARVGDSIFLTATIGLNMIFGGGATTGYTFDVPADAYYNLTYSLKSTTAPTSTLTWSFNATCSTTTVAPSPSPSPTATTKPGKGGKGGGKKP